MKVSGFIYQIAWREMLYYTISCKCILFVVSCEINSGGYMHKRTDCMKHESTWHRNCIIASNYDETLSKQSTTWDISKCPYHIQNNWQ